MTQKQCLEDILNKNSEATKQTNDVLRSVTIDLHVEEPQFEVDIQYYAMRPNHVLVRVAMGGEITFQEAYTTEAAWQIHGNEAPIAVSVDGAAALARGALSNLYSLRGYPDFGHKLTLCEPTRIDGVRYHTIEVEYSDGHTLNYYLDPQTYLLTRKRENVALHPDIDPTAQWAETIFSDFRNVDGFLFAFRSQKTDLTTGEQMQLTSIREVTVNPDLEPTIFQMP